MANIQKHEDVSYLKEMLFHEYNIYLGLGAGVLSVALGFISGGLALVPVIGFVAAEVVGAMIVPELGIFKHAIDNKYKSEKDKKLRDFLLSEISMRNRVLESDQNFKRYEMMVTHIKSLKRIAEQKDTGLSNEDLDNLKKATIDFLKLWLAKLVLLETDSKAKENEIKRRIVTLEKAAASATDMIEKSKWQKDVIGLKRMLSKQDNREARIASLEAKMISIVDSFEEIYHRVMTNPKASAANLDLDSTISAMMIEEQVDFELEQLSVSAYR